jgi:hypothetical protein
MARDVRLYVFSGYATLCKSVGHTVKGHKFKNEGDAKDYVARRRKRGVWTRTQLVLIEYFKKGDSKIIELIEPDD